MREKLRWLLLAGLAVAPVSASAQEYEFPTLNTIGRFLGVGYSHTGYHGRRDGRFNAIQARHPASNYSSGALGFPYNPAYQPYRPVHVSPAYATPAQPYASSATPNVAPALPGDKPEEVKPAKPVGPPPQWLKPHLKTPETETDRSPSDRKQTLDRKEQSNDEVYGELTPPRQPSSRAESPFYIEPDQTPTVSDTESRQVDDTTLEEELLSDDLLGDDLLGEDILSDDALGAEDDSATDVLLDSDSEQGDLLNPDSDDLLLEDDDLLLDDDDLLLDDDDLSARRYQRRYQSQPRTATKPGQHRKVSVLQSPIPTPAPPLPQTNHGQQRQSGYAQYQQPSQYGRPANAGPSSFQPNTGQLAAIPTHRYLGTPNTSPQQHYPVTNLPGHSVSNRSQASIQAAAYRQWQQASANSLRTATNRTGTNRPTAQPFPQFTHQRQLPQPQRAPVQYQSPRMYR